MKTAKASIFPLGLFVILTLAIQSWQTAYKLSASAPMGVHRLDDENIAIAFSEHTDNTNDRITFGNILSFKQNNIDAQRAIATTEEAPNSPNEEEIDEELNELIESESDWSLFEVFLIKKKKVVKSDESDEEMIKLSEKSGETSGMLEINEDYIDDEGRNKTTFTLKTILNGKELVFGPMVRKGQDLIAIGPDASGDTFATIAEGPHHLKINLTSGIHQGSLFVFCKSLTHCQEEEEAKLQSDSPIKDEEPFIDESSEKENQD